MEQKNYKKVEQSYELRTTDYELFFKGSIKKAQNNNITKFYFTGYIYGKKSNICFG
jgi:hypothetical protein